MSNLFLLHHNDGGEHTHIHSCHSFCSRCPRHLRLATDCCQERVWCGLQVLATPWTFGRFSEKQGSFTKVSSQVVAGREVWQFLLSKAGEAICPPIERDSRVSKRVLEPGGTSFEVAAKCLLFIIDSLQNGRRAALLVFHPWQVGHCRGL